MLKSKSIIWLVLLLVVGIGAACDGQTDEANKLVDEGNAIVKKSNDISAKAADSLNALMGEKMTQAEDLEQYKTANKAKFDEVVSLYEQLDKSGTEAAAKFEQASKLNTDAKFKEYAAAKAQEFKKRAEIDRVSATFVKSFLAEKDAEKADRQVADYNKKNADMIKEADGLMAKADQIVKDNPGVFK